LLAKIISAICYLYVCMFEYISDVCGFSLPVCNKGCVRQSGYIHSLSIENTTGMPYLKIIILSIVVLYS